MTNRVPWWYTEIGEVEKRSVNSAFSRRAFSMGPVTAELEEKLAEFLDVPYVVAAPTGTAAITMALMASGVGVGDEVIVPDLTWIATAQAVAMLGARVVCADCRPDLPLIDPEEVRKKVTRRTRAVIPVHLNGRRCDMESLGKIARQRRLLLIEDACKALGSGLPGQRLGTLGDLGCYSLGMVSLVSCGYGGAVATRNKRHYERLKCLRWHGVPKKPKEIYATSGFNFKYSDILAAIGLAQMQRVPEKIAHQKKIYEAYRDGLRGLAHLQVIPVDIASGELPICFEVTSARRERIIAYLARHNVEGLRFHLPIHQAAYLKNPGSFPNAARFGRQGFILPCGPSQPLANVERCIDLLRRWRA